MSAIVKLPRAVPGEELSDAIEEAAKKAGLFVNRAREIYYESGSVKAAELKSTLTIRLPEKTIKGWFRTREQVVPSPYNYFSITVPASNKPSSIVFETFAATLQMFPYTGGSWTGAAEVGTSDDLFNEKLKSAFEQFLAHFFRILEVKSVEA